MITIREARPEDIRSCLAIQSSHGDETFTERDFFNSINNPNAVFLVAESGKAAEVVGFIVGFVVPTRSIEAMVHSTMVDKPLERRGIGRTLVRRFANFVFTERGVRMVYAEVESGPDVFYSKCGFKKVHVWDSMRLLDSEFGVD